MSSEEDDCEKVCVNRWKGLREEVRLAEPSFIGDCPTSVGDPTSLLHFTASLYEYSHVCVTSQDRDKHEACEALQATVNYSELQKNAVK